MAAGDVIANVTTNNSRQGAVFDGVDDYIEIAHNDNQLGKNLSNGFTISAWINPTSSGGGTAGSSGYILDKSSAGAGADGFYLGSNLTDDKWQLTIDQGTTVKSTNAMTIGVWTHILVTVSSAQLANMYLNGTITGTPNTDLIKTIADITTTGVMKIGNRFGSTDKPFDGVISDVQMWNRVLSADEIAQVYAGFPDIKTGRIVNYKLNGTYGDATNSGTHFTIRDDAIAAAIAAQRVNPTSVSGHTLFTGLPGGQILSAIIEED